jgi:CheY-like chemotaxis protein
VYINGKPREYLDVSIQRPESQIEHLAVAIPAVSVLRPAYIGVRALLIDENPEHAQQLALVLTHRGLTVVHAAHIGEAMKHLRNPAHTYDLAILVMGERSRSWLTVLRSLQRAHRQTAIFEVPLFLCVSRLQLGPEFQLQIERMGARYVFER